MKIIRVGGKDYRLKLTVNAMSDFRILNDGRGIMSALNFLEFDEIRALYHVALVYGSENYKGEVESTGDLMQQYMDEHKVGYEEVADIIAEVVDESLGMGKQRKPAKTIKPAQRSKPKHPNLQTPNKTPKIK